MTISSHVFFPCGLLPVSYKYYTFDIKGWGARTLRLAYDDSVGLRAVYFEVSLDLVEQKEALVGGIMLFVSLVWRCRRRCPLLCSFSNWLLFHAPCWPRNFDFIEEPGNQVQMRDKVKRAITHSGPDALQSSLIVRDFFLSFLFSFKRATQATI